MPRPHLLEQMMSRYRQCLDSELIDIGQLRQLAIVGIPEELKLRGYYWQILLGYLPLQRNLWGATLAAKRRAYQVSKTACLCTPAPLPSPLLRLRNACVRATQR